MPCGQEAVWTSHWFGTDPSVFVVLCCLDLQSGKYRRQQCSNFRRTSSSSRFLPQDFGDNFRFMSPRMRRQLPHGRLEVGEYLVRRRFMIVVKHSQLHQD